MGNVRTRCVKRRNKRAVALFSFLMMFALLVGCSGDESGKQVLSNAAQMNAPAYSIGVPQGAAAMTAVEKNYPKCKIEYFGSLHDGYLAVKHRKIDAFAFDRHTLEYVTLQNPDLALMDEKIADESIVVGSSLARKELMAKIDTFVRQYRADGTYRDMYNRWVKGKDSKMPDLAEPKNPTMTLSIGTDGLNEPMSYYADGKLTGFDIEFAKRLAIFLNAKITFQTMEFSALIIAAESGKIDLLIANLNATAERKKRMLFSDTYVDSEIAFLVRKDRLAQTPPKQAGAVAPGQEIKDLGKLATGRVGILTGTTTEAFMAGKYPKAVVSRYDNIADAVTALQGSKLDYVITASTLATNFAKNNNDLSVLPDPLIDEGAAIGVAKGNEPLLHQINDVLARFRTDGTLDRIVSLWIKEDLPQESTPIPKAKSGKILRVAVSANREPMCFVQGNTYKGLDCELIERIAYELGMRVQYLDMQFSALVVALQSGKADVVISNMTPTKERKEKINFTQIYFQNPQVALVKKPSGVAKNTDFSQFAGKKIGILTGSIFDAMQKKDIPQAIPEYFNNVADQTAAVKTGKIAGFLIDEPIARDIMNNTPGVTIFKKMVSANGYAFAFSKGDKALRDQANVVLAAMKADGTLKKIDARWFRQGRSDQGPPRHQTDREERRDPVRHEQQHRAVRLYEERKDHRLRYRDCHDHCGEVRLRA